MTRSASSAASRLLAVVLTLLAVILAPSANEAWGATAPSVVGQAIHGLACIYDRADAPAQLSGASSAGGSATCTGHEGRSSAIGSPPGAMAWVGVAAETGTGWVLPQGGGGANIGGRWFTEHALERMAPRTPQVMAELESRAMARAQAAGVKPGTSEFGQWWRTYGPAPRNIPPSVVESEIANPGSTGVRVITNSNGDVVTVIPGR